MPPEIKRFYKLKEDYRVVITQIAATKNIMDLANLKEYRNAMVVEARDISRRLCFTGFTWCGRQSDLG
jgi:hypothetical protein